MFHTDSGAFNAGGVNAVLARLEARCAAFASDAGAPGAIDWSTEARYPDQAWEIEVPLKISRFRSPADVAGLLADFHRTHQEVFAVSDPASPIETVGWNAEVRCRIGRSEPGRIKPVEAASRLPSRKVHFLGAKDWSTVEVYRFEALPTGTEIAGPAIVESSFTSIVIDAGARAVRDVSGSLVIDVGG